MNDARKTVASRFDSGATLTHASAKAALAAGLQRIAAGAGGVDCAPLTQFDSSALAVLLAWVRAAATRGASFEIINLPAGLASLAQAYGVDTLLTPGDPSMVASARH
ncbi:STAS domain-containing protein [Paraburkholderia sp. UYCP14C]|uniref:STAS domain-containing protein n=1 Tax=Paraburkholderia sp. UYCP14C TaxID=2511130 RepID=UPI00101ECA87|nr:STAS domain-containing protein [Paraburkholderia sp. UYCP14C]RZF28721.1 STAS domain-containing protein [Paraburkholderia sp. UYCP14C]